MGKAIFGVAENGSAIVELHTDGQRTETYVLVANDSGKLMPNKTHDMNFKATSTVNFEVPPNDIKGLPSTAELLEQAVRNISGDSKTPTAIANEAGKAFGERLERDGRRADAGVKNNFAALTEGVNLVAGLPTGDSFAKSNTVPNRAAEANVGRTT